MSKEINFIENKTYIGMFSLFSEEYCGKLVYESGKIFKLTLYNTPPILFQKKLLTTNDNADSEEKVLNSITGVIYDENDKCYSVILANCFCTGTPVIGMGCTKFVFDYAIFSEDAEFELENDKNFTMNIYFDTWNEFCYPQGFKTWTTMQNEPNINITLKNKLNVIFSDNISAEPINASDLFSNLFVADGKNRLKKDEIAELNNKLKEIMDPYKYRLFKKRDETHKWFITVKNVPNVTSIPAIIWKFNMLINILTYDYTTNLDMIKLRVKNSDRKGEYASFYYLCKVDRFEKRHSYKFQQSAFQCESFSKDEWKIILNNLFAKKNKAWLISFFNVLCENNSNGPLNIFHITRYIDYIGAIGVSKKYRALKYEQTLLDFVQDLDKELKYAVLRVCRNNLKMIKVKNNNQKLRGWSLIGKKLSEFRAYTAHAEEKRQILEFYKAYEVYKILELIIIDNIFEILGVTKRKRLQYKTYYLKQQIGHY